MMQTVQSVIDFIKAEIQEKEQYKKSLECVKEKVFSGDLSDEAKDEAILAGYRINDLIIEIGTLEDVLKKIEKKVTA